MVSQAGKPTGTPWWLEVDRASGDVLRLDYGRCATGPAPSWTMVSGAARRGRKRWTNWWKAALNAFGIASTAA